MSSLAIIAEMFALIIRMRVLNVVKTTHVGCCMISVHTRLSISRLCLIYNKLNPCNSVYASRHGPWRKDDTHNREALQFFFFIFTSSSLCALFFGAKVDGSAVRDPPALSPTFAPKKKKK